jgi:hypothetical protein
MSIIAPFTNKELDKVSLSDETKNFYCSNPNELKRVLMERDLYKLLYNEQQKRINIFTNQFESIMNQKISSTGKTLRGYAYDRYWEDSFSRIKF